MNNIRISTIVPYLKRNDEQHNRLIDNATINDIRLSGEVIITDQSPQGLPLSFKMASNVAYQHIPLHPDKAFSPGLARNLAISSSRFDFIFFLDVDLLYSPTLSNELCSRAEGLA
ncbi:hypothetical protein OEZ66_38380, partial [Escherichia coli]|nr:hypothetical protein [Escherichia coli]